MKHCHWVRIEISEKQQKWLKYFILQCIDTLYGILSKRSTWLLQKLKQLQQQCLSPLDFWQCKGCRSPWSRTVGTRLGRRAPWGQASQATPINQIRSISVTVMTIIIIIIIILSPVKLLIMRSVEQKKFSLVGELMPTCSMEVQVQSLPKLKDNIYKDHWQWQSAQATLHSQPKNFYTAPTHPTPRKDNAPPPLLKHI